MLQAQGLRPPDPYRTLQLHPLAPRALVDDAYWALLERAKAAGGPSRSARIAALDEAYAVLADAGRRAAYDEADGSGGASHTGRPGRAAWPAVLPPLAEQRTRPDTEHPDFYEVLCVDREADALVIGIAYRAMARAVTGPGAEATRRRGLLDEAYRTLSNRELRAQYDLALARRRDGRGSEPRIAAPDTRPPYLAMMRARPAPAPAHVPEPLAARVRAPGPGGTPPAPRPRGLLGRLRGRAHERAPRDALTAEERRLLGLRGDAPAHRPGGRARVPEPDARGRS